MTYRSYQSFKLTPIWIIIAVNFLLFVVIFIAIYAAPRFADKLVELFGLTPVMFWDRPWTIVTNLFMHAGWWHIIANMLTLYFFGTYLSRLIGEGKFLSVYFGGGILGNVLFILLGPPLSVAVGASGAVFALGGALTVMRPKLRVFIFPIPVPLPLWVAVVGVFLILTILPMRFNWPIGWEAHLGGLIVGLIAGYFFRRRERYFF